MSKGKIVDVEEVFFKLLDENTPYYQDAFRLLRGEEEDFRYLDRNRETCNTEGDSEEGTNG